MAETATDGAPRAAAEDALASLHPLLARADRTSPSEERRGRTSPSEERRGRRSPSEERRRRRSPSGERGVRSPSEERRRRRRSPSGGSRSSSVERRGRRSRSPRHRRERSERRHSRERRERSPRGGARRYSPPRRRTPPPPRRSPPPRRRDDSPPGLGEEERRFIHEMERRRHHRRKEESKMDAEERSRAELDRDLRTVLITNFHPKFSELQVARFFEEKCGKVADITFVRDRVTKKSKSIGYIEFEERPSMHEALSINGKAVLDGCPITIQPSEAEKNRMPAAPPKPQVPQFGPTQVFVSNLHPEVVDESVLRDVFQPFGTLERVQIVRDENRVSRGIAFVQYKSWEDAAKAQQKLNGLDLCGNPLKLMLMPDKESRGQRRQAMEQQQIAMQRGMEPGGAPHDEDVGELDEDGGYRLNATKRAMLMAKMQRDDNIVMPRMPIVPMQPLATPCIVLRNMWGPEDHDDAFFDDIRLDVEEEAGKCGALLHLFVDRDNPGGNVFLKFGAVDEAKRAHDMLNQRYFAGNLITVEYIPPELYTSRFNV